MDVVRVCLLGQITYALFEVAQEIRKGMPLRPDCAETATRLTRLPLGARLNP